MSPYHANSGYVFLSSAATYLGQNSSEWAQRPVQKACRLHQVATQKSVRWKCQPGSGREKREMREVTQSCSRARSVAAHHSYLMLGFISFSSSSSLSSTCCMTRSAEPSSMISTYDLRSSSLICHRESLSPSDGDRRCC